MWSVLNEILLYSGIDQKDFEYMKSKRDTLENIVYRASRNFDEYVMSIGKSQYFKTVDVELLSSKRARHIMMVFMGRFDRVLANNVKRIGRMHLEHNVSRNDYMLGYLYISREIMQLIDEEFRLPADDRIKATRIAISLIFIDITIALETDHVAFIG